MSETKEPWATSGFQDSGQTVTGETLAGSIWRLGQWQRRQGTHTSQPLLKEVVLQNPLEDMVDMFVFSLGVDEDVIQVDTNMFVEHFTEHSVEKSLEENRQD